MLVTSLVHGNPKFQRSLSSMTHKAIVYNLVKRYIIAALLTDIFFRSLKFSTKS